MLVGQPSRTARGAAIRRADHQILDDGRVFADPFAVDILCMSVNEILEEQATDPPPVRLRHRLSLAARSRFAENRLAIAVTERDVSQYVVLGAGLDTFAVRNPYGEALRVVELDHPATQAWKRDLLAAAGIAVPPWLTFVPADFDVDTLTDALARGALDVGRRTFVSWLGVASYLTRETVLATLTVIADLPGGSELVFDFSEPPDSLGPEQRKAYDARAARVAEFGEPWRSSFPAAEMVDHLRDLGFFGLLDLGPQQIARRFFPALAGHGPNQGGHFVHAWTG